MRASQSGSTTPVVGHQPAPALSVVLADYSRSLRSAYATGKTPPNQFWSAWLCRVEESMQAHPDDPLRQQGWSVIISIHNQLDEHVEGFESAWVGLGEAVQPQDVAARCADVIAALPFLASSGDPELVRLAEERRLDAYARLWDLIERQRNDQNPAPAGWMTPAMRSCFANQFAFLQDQGKRQEASELEMSLALALALPDYRDHEGSHAGDHALNAMLRAPSDLLDQLAGSFMEVMETGNSLRTEPAFFLGALFGSTSLDPIPVSERVLPFIAKSQTADEVYATARLARRLAGHPDAEAGSSGHDRWREIAREVLAISELIVLLPAEEALSNLSGASPSHPDIPGLFSDARTSALLLTVKLEDDAVKQEIAALILRDGHGMAPLAQNILK